MYKRKTDYERLEIVKEFKVSKLSVSEFAFMKGISRTTLRDWINAFDNIDGSFVRLSKKINEHDDGVVLSGDDAVVKLLSAEDIIKKSSHFSRFDHSIVVIEFEKIKVTTSLSQALEILEKYYDRFK